MKVFCSYSRHDSEFAIRLARDLEQRGHSVWIDTEDISGESSDRWRRAIVNGIRNADVLMVILSPNSIASTNVERELTVAAESGRRLVPVVHLPCELPEGFEYDLAGIQRIDFSIGPYEDALEQLMRHLGTGGSAENGADVQDASPAPAAPVAPALTAPTPMPNPATSPITGVAETPDGPAQTNGPLPAWRQPRSLAFLGAVAAVAAIVAVIVAATGPGDPAGAPAAVTVSTLEISNDGPEQVDTVAVQPTVSIDTVPPTPSVSSSPATIPVTATSTPVATDPEPSTSEPPPTVVTTESEALLLLDTWAKATSARDWETVRRVSEYEKNFADSRFTDPKQYGADDAIPRMERVQFYLSSVQPSADGWMIEGAVFAWDLGREGGTTNVLCRTWAVETGATRVELRAEYHTDRLDVIVGYIVSDQFDDYFVQVCASASAA